MKPINDIALSTTILRQACLHGFKTKASKRITVTAFLLLTLSSCTDPNGTEYAETGTIAAANPAGANTPIISQPNEVIDSIPALQALQNDPLLLNDVPAPTGATLLSDTGLQVVYTSYIQEQIVDLGFIEQQWTLMVDCVDVGALTPTLIIKNAEVLPLTLNDYVYLDDGGEPTATSSPSLEGTTIQISMTDLDGTPEQNGFALRNVFGEYLWRTSLLPIDEYPSACALLSS